MPQLVSSFPYRPAGRFERLAHPLNQRSPCARLRFAISRLTKVGLVEEDVKGSSYDSAN